MRRLGMVGATFRRASQEELARYSFAQEQRLDKIVELHRFCGLEESIVLSTCNRFEVVFAVPDGVTVPSARTQIYRYFEGKNSTPNEGGDVDRLAAKAFHAYAGEGAAEHLFCVTSSLDSMNPGESQIVGQVRAAYLDADRVGLIGSRLSLLFDWAFRAARKVRRSTGIGAGSVSMASLAAGVIEDRLQETIGSRVVLIGAGEMTRQCAESVRAQLQVELVFVNRTVERVQALARGFSSRAVSLEEFSREPCSCHVLFTSTSAPEPILDAQVLTRMTEANRRDGMPPPIIVDLAVPRDTDPDAALDLGCELIDVDQLEGFAKAHRRKLEDRLIDARVVVDEALEAFRFRMVDREIGPVIGALQKRYLETVHHQVARLFGSAHGSKRQPTEDELRRWAESLARKFAHIPVLGLKRVAFDQGWEAVESFLAGLGGELAEELIERAQDGPMQSMQRHSEEMES